MVNMHCNYHFWPRQLSYARTQAFSQRRYRTLYPSAAVSGNEYIPIKKKKKLEIGPSLDWTKEEAVQLQLEVLHGFSTVPVGLPCPSLNITVRVNDIGFCHYRLSNTMILHIRTLEWKFCTGDTPSQTTRCTTNIGQLTALLTCMWLVHS